MRNLHLSDRQRVEIALPARLMRRCMAAIVEGTVNEFHRPRDPQHMALIADLGRCCDEALCGLDTAKAEKLRARIDRAAHHALLDYEDCALIKVCQMVMRWTCDRLECGDLTLGEGSLFESCFERLQSGLTEHADLWEAVASSAAKQAIKLHLRIQSQGYFGG